MVAKKKNPFFFSQPRFWKGILNFQTLQAVDGLNSRNRWELKLCRTRKKLGLSRCEVFSQASPPKFKNSNHSIGTEDEVSG